MANLHKVVKGTVGAWPVPLKEGDVFDADDPKFRSFEIERLKNLGVIALIQPEPEEALALAELGDRELTALASRLGVTDVAKKKRRDLVREVLDAQAKLPKAAPAPEQEQEPAGEGSGEQG